MIPHSTQNLSCAEESRCCSHILVTGSMLLPGALAEQSAGFLDYEEVNIKEKS